MYEVGDKIVYPCMERLVEKIEEGKFLGSVRRYYIMKKSTGTMNVMVPEENSEEISLASLRFNTALSILNEFSQIPVEDNCNWNKRSGRDMMKLKSVDIARLRSGEDSCEPSKGKRAFRRRAEMLVSRQKYFNQ
jgi:CarD family transcriptional regulator